MRRHPAVAGYFYQGSAEALRRQVGEFILPGVGKIKALGILSPHAGLTYSGAVAGAVYSRLDLPGSIVLIGPNHTGLGAPVAAVARGQWETPLGTVDIDESLAAAILAESRRIQEDSLAHLREHSLEIQLPFIQYLKRDFKIVPIQMLDMRLDTCMEVGRAVASAIISIGHGAGSRESGHDVLIVASSDMTHYETAASAKEKDFKAIQRILALDPEGLYRTVKDIGITMCGYGPTVAMLSACKTLGATKAELVKYANSGDVSGDYEQVVGYAGIVIR